MVEAAEALGISLVASASLMQGKMAAWLPQFIVDALGLETMPRGRCNSCAPRRAWSRRWQE